MNGEWKRTTRRVVGWSAPPIVDELADCPACGEEFSRGDEVYEQVTEINGHLYFVAGVRVYCSDECEDGI